MYNLAALCQHKACAYLNLPKKLPQYLDMLATDKTMVYVDASFLGQKSQSSAYKGVWAVTEWGTFKTQVKGQKGSIHWMRRGKGAEVCLAITNELYHLKSVNTGLTVNFEWWRPVYLHYIATFDDIHKQSIVERVYVLLGSSAFANKDGQVECIPLGTTKDQHLVNDQSYQKM